MRLPEHFETARLFARPPRVEDASAAFTCYASDPEAARFLAWKARETVSPVSAFFGASAHHWRTSSGSEGQYPWLLFLRDTNELVGTISIELDGHGASFGYVLGRAFWGRGLMTEALSSLVDWTLAEATLFRAWAVCDVENLASARVLEKAGMQKEGILRRWQVLPTIGPEPRDCLVYGKTR